MRQLILFFIAVLTTGQAVSMGSDRPRYQTTDHSNKTSLTFLVFGDFGHGNAEQTALGAVMHRVCQARGCDMAVTTGDNIYPAGVLLSSDSKFERLFEIPYQAFGRFDFWMILGNHDHRGNGNAQVSYTNQSTRWRMPSADYAVPKLPGWMHIYALDTYPIENRGWQYRNWGDQLVRARNHLCQRTGWKILVGHHPVFSAGRGPNPQMQESLLPVIRDCGVQVYLAGHDHHLEHATLHNPSFEQVIQGAGGEFRTFPNPNPHAQSDADRTLRFVAGALGFGVAVVTPHSFKMDYYDKDGNIRHSFTRERSGVRPGSPQTGDSTQEPLRPRRVR